MVSSPKKTKTTRSHDQRVNGRGKGHTSVEVDTSSIGLGDVQPDARLFFKRRAQRESLEGKYKKAPVRKLWKNHPERFADAIFNFRMDHNRYLSVADEQRVAAWWTAKIANSKTKLGEKYDKDLKKKAKEVCI
jgi:hypothetical protein